MHFSEGALVRQSPLKDSRFWLKKSSGKNWFDCKNIQLANSLVFSYYVHKEGEREKEHGAEEGDAFPIVRKLPIILKGGALES